MYEPESESHLESKELAALTKELADIAKDDADEEDSLSLDYDAEEMSDDYDDDYMDTLMASHALMKASLRSKEIEDLKKSFEHMPPHTDGDKRTAGSRDINVTMAARG